MPVDITTISLKPADFFNKNPALDVPQSRQKENGSVLVLDPLPTQERKVENGGQEACRHGRKSKL